MSAFDTQVGGDHYGKLTIQPAQFCMANSIPFMEGSVIKYVTRWRDKGGVEDLRKARHFLDMLIEDTEKDRKTADMFGATGYNSTAAQQRSAAHAKHMASVATDTKGYENGN